MEDQAILALAVAEQRIVITMNKDFGELHFLLGLPHCGILLLRLDDADSGEKVNAIQAIVALHFEDLPGRFCVFQDGHLRIR
jgi:predicted nuclease of predicted toxin-antitoxin system